MPQPISLILAAHGSEALPLSNQPLHDLAASLKAMGLFDHITPAFLMGQPLMTEVLESLPAGEAIVIPVMTSDGYYLKKLPEKFKQNANYDQFRLSISPVVGLHPAIAKTISDRLAGHLKEHKLTAADTTVVVVGHGTRRNTTSGAATFALVDSLRNDHPGFEIKAAFLDQDPEIGLIANSIETPNCVVLPFLVSLGPHMTHDTPAAFGLPTGHDLQFPLIGERLVAGQTGICLCDSPLAAHEQLPAVIAQMAQCRKTCREPITKCSKTCHAGCKVEHAKLLSSPVSEPSAPPAKEGHVYLVGAGPGDPDLITVGGMKALQQADVVIYDRLISMAVMQWCRDDVVKIDVGKFPQHHRVSQDEINELLVEHASQGKFVVRLKGGDPFVFGRGSEEIAACNAAGVPVRVIPGVSSAIAGPAAAGIPVTSRGIARSFMVVTGQTAPELAGNQLDFVAMARTDTVVLMMARKNLRDIAAGLIAVGRSPETPVACIERATFSDQRVAYATLGGIADQVERLEIRNPMVTVIGEVAEMVDEDLITWAGQQQEHFYAVEAAESRSHRFSEVYSH